jgi:hypothetical protein
MDFAKPHKAYTETFGKKKRLESCVCSPNIVESYRIEPSASRKDQLSGNEDPRVCKGLY